MNGVGSCYSGYNFHGARKLLGDFFFLCSFAMITITRVKMIFVFGAKKRERIEKKYPGSDI